MTRYQVRETTQSTTTPEDRGMLLKTFETWEEARDYSHKLFEENNQKTWISVVIS